MKVIRAKQKGETITAVPAAEDEEPADLLAALKASVAAAKRNRGSARPKRKPTRRQPATRKKTAKR
jgi:non-homologous end joining protein Ku